MTNFVSYSSNTAKTNAVIGIETNVKTKIVCSMSFIMSDAGAPVWFIAASNNQHKGRSRKPIKTVRIKTLRA